MTKKIAVLILLVCCCGALANAQPLSRKQIAQQKAQLAKLEKDLNRLQKKLKSAQVKQLRTDIQDKIDRERTQIKQIKQRLYPAAVKRPAGPATAETAPAAELPATSETGGEEWGTSAETEAKTGLSSGLRHEIGGSAGFFGGLTAFLGEVRVPLRLIFGPATTSLRLATGLAQSNDAAHRLVPVNVDLIFNFPPGWFTGVENYLGAGLNYVALTTGRKQGTVGGEVFYGIVSEGFGGIVYGELGYAILRTGLFPSYKGATVMVGYRKALF